MTNDRNTSILAFQLNNGKDAYFTTIFVIMANDHVSRPDDTTVYFALPHLLCVSEIVVDQTFL